MGITKTWCNGGGRGENQWDIVIPVYKLHRMGKKEQVGGDVSLYMLKRE